MSLSPEEWVRVKAVFDAAVALEATERAAYLARACGDDVALRRQVETMLGSHDAAPTFLETPAAVLLDGLPATDDLIGRTIGPYRLVARIGAGGMGEVYKAEDSKLNRPVALKLLPQHLATDADRLRRFHAEARAASSLNHPHILVVHDFGEVDGRPFIVTEFVEGQTLRQRMQAGPIAVREALDIATQIAGALAAAHTRGLVHRDIKPENVMLRPDGSVKVLDFGLAKLVATESDDAASALLTRPGTVMGTPRYMSPEQARGLPLDARSDLWSLGVVLYEMVAGRAPFEGATSADVLAIILERDVEPIARVPDVPAALAVVLSTALEKDPQQRYHLTFRGQFREAREFSQTHGVQTPADLRAAAGREALIGNHDEARRLIAQALSRDSSQDAQADAVVTVAQVADATQAQSLIDTVRAQFPEATVINAITLPTARAALDLQRGAAADAITELQAVLPYERAGLTAPYLRGYAYLEQRAGAPAAAEFRKLLVNRGRLTVDVLFPLADLGLARALTLTGDTKGAAKVYQDFFTLWKDADSDIPILIEARKELALASSAAR